MKIFTIYYLFIYLIIYYSVTTRNEAAPSILCNRRNSYNGCKMNIKLDRANSFLINISRGFRQLTSLIGGIRVKYSLSPTPSTEKMLIIVICIPIAAGILYPVADSC